MKQLLLTTFIFAILWMSIAVFGSIFQITERRAKVEMKTVLQTDQFDIIDMSNNSVWVGTPGDVTFNILLRKDSTVVSCRCTDGLFQPLICRKYQ